MVFVVDFGSQQLTHFETIIPSRKATKKYLIDKRR